MPVSVPTQEVVKEDDDIPEEHHEEQQQSVPDEPVPEEVPSSSGLEWETATQHNVEIQSSGGVDDKDDPAPLPEPCEEPILPPPMPLLDDKRVALITNKLSSMLFRQKEQLKKDIAKKRALQEKELQLSISKEIERLKSSLLRSGTTTYKRKKEDQEDVEEKSKTPLPSQVPLLLHQAAEKEKDQRIPASCRCHTSWNHQKDKVYCICKTKYDATKFYVGCDTCNNWFHGNCVGITEEMSKTMTEYFCDECKSAKDNQEIYCLCRQPYDDLQFYIGCERCADWFHGRCVGILQVEADNIDEYICPRCDSNTSYNYANLKPLNEHDYNG
ncbi:Nucleosomeremodeling factor subunit NURF301like [Caligus rogercresseyi]|uniref:Nucleosomeremodeling factor subunit NURF301like n=1 Tax=Caligus rogercresseyi TaxID=217165 RepID=A0A7T8HLD0_CALRO|nr:Nucleosomeremodeling factor subunit NURF301like [Caligus rogercresseyi]